jgi:hypothetical protein
MHAADADEVAETDAATRLAELTGEPSPDDDVTFDDEIPSDAADAAASAPDDVDEGPADETPTGSSTSDEASAMVGLDEEAPGADGPAAAVDGVPSTAADPVVSDALVADAEVVDALDRETDTRAGRS